MFTPIGRLPIGRSPHSRTVLTQRWSAASQRRSIFQGLTNKPYALTSIPDRETDSLSQPLTTHQTSPPAASRAARRRAGSTLARPRECADPPCRLPGPSTNLSVAYTVTATRFTGFRLRSGSVFGCASNDNTVSVCPLVGPCVDCAISAMIAPSPDTLLGILSIVNV